MLSVGTDGSFQLQHTLSMVEVSATSSDPAIPATPEGSTILEGVPLIMDFGPDRWTTSVSVAPGVSVSDEQEAFASSLSFSMPGAGFPLAAVGVGATWTVPSTRLINGIPIATSTSHQLISVEGDLYIVSTTQQADLSTADPADFPSDITAASGTITETSSITGSLSNAMQHRETTTVRTLTTYTFTDGDTVSVDSTGEIAWEQRPA